MATGSYPRLKARTRAFTSGAPRSFTVAADGCRVVFLRSAAGDDPRGALWAIDPADGTERLVVAPDALDELAGLRAGEEMTPEEAARRERAREAGSGIVAYATDRDARLAAVAHSGRLILVDLVTGAARRLEVPEPVYDPRLDPAGRTVAFASGEGLWVVSTEDGTSRCLRSPDAPTVSWGLAEFVAAEELERSRGLWWSPDGDALLAARVDEAPVREWWIADPAHPEIVPRAVRYPAAGTPNAEVSLWLLRVDGPGEGIEVSWDRAALPYVATADWDAHGPLLSVMSRDQRRMVVLAVDPVTGATRPLREIVDDAWVDVVPGVPRRLDDGRLLTVEAAGDVDGLCLDGAAVPVGARALDVRAVLGADAAGVLVAAGDGPIETHVYRVGVDGQLTCLTAEAGAGAGVHTAVAGGGVVVLGSSGMDHDGVRWSVGGRVVRSEAETPALTPRVTMMRLGARELAAGLLLPSGDDGERPLPVLLDPYGGPHAARARAARGLWRDSQWFADQGFAVLVVDGRGTPGRGRAWARAVRGDFAGPVLEDQVDALHALAERMPRLDLERVAIRGWSFGGYLAALAVLRRPDVFTAAVAGAPVTDWRLYDTAYTERYLGTDPYGADRDAYERSSLIADAAGLRRSLLLIHGLADDNVTVAHTLTFSQRLTENGVPHTVLPLTGITHMTPQEAIAENLLLLQVAFLRSALGD